MLACLAAATASAGVSPPRRAATVFPASNPWNQRVDKLPVAADSTRSSPRSARDARPARRLRLGPLGRRPDRHPDHRRRRASQPKSRVSFDYADESDRGPYPIPRTSRSRAAAVDGDRHAIIVDRDTCKLYELYALYPQGGGWKAGSGAIWSLRSNRLRPAGWTSADAAGLPIFPGLARYDEVKRGAIDHALRFTVSRTRKRVRLAGAALRERRRPTRRCRRWACACG